MLSGYHRFGGAFRLATSREIIHRGYVHSDGESRKLSRRKKGKVHVPRRLFTAIALIYGILSKPTLKALPYTFFAERDIEVVRRRVEFIRSLMSF